MAFQSEREETIGELGDGPGSRIFVKVGTRKSGDPFCDVRKYYEAEDGSGEWKPTKKGVFLDPETLGELRPLLHQADEKLTDLLSFKPKAAA